MDEQITPLAKKLAEENSIDWRFIKGSGPSGKVIERDILSYLARIMSGELDLPSTPDASEPAGPNAGSSMPDLGQVANFEAMSANMAKEGVDLNSMLGDFGGAQTGNAMPAIPELDFSTPAVVQADAVPAVPEYDFSMQPSTASIVADNTSDGDDTVFEFEMDDVDDVVAMPPVNVAPVTSLEDLDFIQTQPEPVAAPVSSFDEDQIMTVTDDHDFVPAAHHDVAPSLAQDEISVNISGEFEKVPDPLEDLPFELDSLSKGEPAHTLIVDDATFPIETELVVEDIAPAPVEMPVVHHQPSGMSLEGLAAAGIGAVGLGAVLGHEDHVPVVSDQSLESQVPVLTEPEVSPPVIHFETEPVAPEPMIVHFDPEPEPLAIQPVEPEPVHEAVVAEQPVFEEVQHEPAVEPVPAEVAPVMPFASSEPAALSAGVHKDFFNTNVLRRQFHASALNDIRAQISKALNGRDVQLGVFVGRAAQRGLYLLGTTEEVTLHKLEEQLVPLTTAGLHHSFIEAVQSVNHADVGEAKGLAIVDASNLGVDDLIVPTKGALLSLGRISNDLGTLTLSGDFPAKAGAEFLAQVAGALETPVGLVL
jgi:hypothetical protein